MNNKTIEKTKKLGQKLKQLRLNANLTQMQLADLIGKSRTAIERAEQGKCKLSTFVSILLAVNAAEQLDGLLTEITPSPVSLAKTQGKQRKRASGKGQNPVNTAQELEW